MNLTLMKWRLFLPKLGVHFAIAKIDWLQYDQNWRILSDQNVSKICSQQNIISNFCLDSRQWLPWTVLVYSIKHWNACPNNISCLLTSWPYMTFTSLSLQIIFFEGSFMPPNMPTIFKFVDKTIRFINFDSRFWKFWPILKVWNILRVGSSSKKIQETIKFCGNPPLKSSVWI